ncbi:RMD1 family protein [Chryseolinea lacunae]|uniref:RMD1 family protein n=1 Tax=Chryseolinea lacunae TaxID=2801331 RepID=A0ABS1KLF5_9BACT|nr:RMD1 family protein [Chryseolinea lacunae]MBL0740298.1 RMD1 family protein [Chryseolinea lacunae]
MPQTVKLSAFLVANQFDIKAIKTFFDIKPLADSSSELFYVFDEKKFQYYFNFGVVVFAGYTEDEMKWAIKTVQPFQRNEVTPWLRDDHIVHATEGSELRFDFDELILEKIDDKVIRITMFNLAQSVALDHYHAITENLLTEAKVFTNQLEQTGKLKISRKNMMRFLGRALNTQNDIAENIYIFDAPDQVWDDAYLDKLHQGLIKHFDLRVRFSEIEYTLRIIEDNLSVFREIINQRESNLLEWIIIILILVEVFDLLITKLLRLT